MRPTRFNEFLAQWYHVFGHNEESCKFSFSYQGHDKLDNLINGEDRSIVTWNGVVFGEHDMGVSTTTRFADVEVGSVSTGIQDHVAGAIENSVIGISHNIVKQLRYGFISLFGCG